MSVGTRIKEARVALGYTQEHLAETLSVSKGTIGNYENDTAYPRTEILYRLCAALHCDANYIYQDDMDAVTSFPVAFPERDMLKKYRALDDHGRTMVDYVLNAETARIEKYGPLESNETSGKPMSDEEAIALASERYGSVGVSDDRQAESV